MREREREFSYIKTAQLQNADFFQKTKIMLERDRESSAMGQNLQTVEYIQKTNYVSDNKGWPVLVFDKESHCSFEQTIIC
jgi:hypothetical protein